VAGQIVHRAGHVAHGAVDRHRVHQLRGPVHLGVLGQVAVVQVGGEGGEALGGQAVTHALELGVQPPPLLHHDDPRRGTLLRRGQVAARPVAVAVELHHVAHARRR
jgi:hypothetical protein